MGEKMTKENTKQTSIRVPVELYKKIEEMAYNSQRKPAEQIRFMLMEYIKIKEG